MVEVEVDVDVGLLDGEEERDRVGQDLEVASWRADASVTCWSNEHSVQAHRDRPLPLGAMRRAGPARPT